MATAEATPAATIAFEGKTYTVPEVSAQDTIQAVWDHLRERADPIDVLSAQYDRLKDKPELREALIDRAFKQLTSKQTTVTKKDALEFLDSPDGVVWVVAWMLRKAHPEMTEDLARRIVISERLEVMKRVRDKAARQMIEATGRKVEADAATVVVAPAPELAGTT